MPPQPPLRATGGGSGAGGLLLVMVGVCLALLALALGVAVALTGNVVGGVVFAVGGVGCFYAAAYVSQTGRGGDDG